MTTRINDENLISICLVIRNESARAVDFLRRTNQILSAEYSFYEILVIDNHSTDGTDSKIAAELSNLPNIRLIRLSRPYDQDTAVTAALDNAIGDYVILLDLETELSVIGRLLERAALGDDVVLIRRDLRTIYSSLDRFAGGFLFKICSLLLGYSVVMEEAFARLFSRRFVNAVTQIKSKKHFTRHFGSIVGYKHSYIQSHGEVSATPQNRASKIGFLFELVLSNSIAPLRFAALLGLTASLLSLAYIAYVLIVTVVLHGIVAEGWLTLSLMTGGMFFLLFTIMAILAEYIGRILQETKDDPAYFVESEFSSKISSYSKVIAQEKLNIDTN